MRSTMPHLVLARVADRRSKACDPSSRAPATQGARQLEPSSREQQSGRLPTDAKLNGANRLKFTPDGKRVSISILSTGDLFVYDVASRKEVKRVSLGKGCAGILMDPDGSRAFVGCTAANYVAVVDLKTLTVTSHLNVGGGPDGLTWAKQP